MKEELKIAIAQMDICWEDEAGNLIKINQLAQEAAREEADLLVLPEMVTTGFMMDAEALADLEAEVTVFDKLQRIANEHTVALMGSVGVKERPKNYNRGFLLTPDAEPQFQNKRHLFVPGKESELMTQGREREIWNLKGWHILPIVCYDLRFPVWCKNNNLEYDILMAVANWPEPRVKVWSTLLKARAMENLCYVVGVNRVGVDANKLNYTGESAIIDERGEYIAQCQPGAEQLQVGTLSYSRLQKFRKKFPTWKDSDNYEIQF